MAKTELTTMCMIIDRKNNKVLVQDRKKSWKGFSGELTPETEEGDVRWVDIAELPHLQMAPGFAERLPMFLEDKYVEGFGVWNEENQNRPMKWS